MGRAIMSETKATGTALSDEALFRRYAEQRQEDDFSELVSRHQQFAYLVAFSKTGAADLAEEAVQDAFIKLARTSAHEMDRYASFRKLFFGMIRNSARHRQRAQQRYVSNVQSPRYLQEALAMSKARHEEPPETSAQTRTELERALGQLDEDCRESVCLHFLEGMSQMEIANMIGVNQSVISRRIKAGLESLRCHLAQAGVTCAVAALPSLLKDAKLLAVTPQFSASLLAQGPAWVQAVKAGAHVSTRAAAVGSTAKWIAVVVLAVAAGTGGIWWSVQLPPQAAASTNNTPGAAGPVPAAAPTQASYAWNFNTKESPANLVSISESKWTWLAKGGPDGSGCIETQTVWCSMALDVKIERFPLLVTFDYQNRMPQLPGQEGWGVWLLWTAHKGIADFWNIAPMNIRDDANGPWMTARYVVTERYCFMESGKSMHLSVSERLPGASLQLGMQGRQRLDNLKIAPLDPAEVPDLSKYLSALDALPADKRTGLVELSELPCPLPGKKVAVKFFPAEPAKP